MRFEGIRQIVDGIPYIQPERGHVLYRHIRTYRPRRVLELGIGHGVSSCYMAAALDENGNGHLTCVDLLSAEFCPSAEELLSQAGLEERVCIYREQSSYTWFLKKCIEERTPLGGICEPEFDLCYIDGPKNWTIDGAAFFMVDKLLNPGGWIIFDDYDWTYDSVAESNSGMSMSDGISIRGMSEEERTQPHIEAIFRLLVTQHPDYGEFMVDGNQWAWARKVRAESRMIQLIYKPDLKYALFSRLRQSYHHVQSHGKSVHSVKAGPQPPDG